MAAEMWPPANTITISADPIASGASSGGAFGQRLADGEDKKERSEMRILHARRCENGQP